MQHYSSIGLNYDLEITFIFYSLSNWKIIQLNFEEYTIEVINDSEGVITLESDLELSNYNKQFEVKMPEINHPIFHYNKIRKVYLGKESNTITSNAVVLFDEAFGFIQLSFDMKDSILKPYLADWDCDEEITPIDQYRSKTTIYSHFIYDKTKYKLDMDMPNLVYEFDKRKLIINKDELFRKYDRIRVGFMIIFIHNNITPQWIIGLPMI